MPNIVAGELRPMECIMPAVEILFIAEVHAKISPMPMVHIMPMPVVHIMPMPMVEIMVMVMIKLVLVLMEEVPVVQVAKHDASVYPRPPPREGTPTASAPLPTPPAIPPAAASPPPPTVPPPAIPSIVRAACPGVRERIIVTTSVGVQLRHALIAVIVVIAVIVIQPGLIHDYLIRILIILAALEDNYRRISLLRRTRREPGVAPRLAACFSMFKAWACVSMNSRLFCN